MPKRTSKKTTKRAVTKKRTKKSPAKKTTKKATKKPQSTEKRDTSELSDDQRARIWVLREERQSLREIATEIGCHNRSVSRVLNEDPGRAAALAAVQREERARSWEQIEDKSLKILRDALDDVHATIRTQGGRKKRIVGKDASVRLTHLTRLVGPLRMAADSATAKSQLLSGGVTERIGSSSGGIGDPDNMDDNQILDLARKYGLEDKLPARLREKANAEATP